MPQAGGSGYMEGEGGTMAWQEASSEVCLKDYIADQGNSRHPANRRLCLPLP